MDETEAVPQRGVPIRYRSISAELEGPVPETVRRHLDALMGAELLLCKRIKDDRVARRVVRRGRRRIEADLACDPPRKLQPGPRLRVPYRDMDPVTSTHQVACYQGLLDRIGDISLPAGAAGLALLHGRVLGDEGEAPWRQEDGSWGPEGVHIAAPPPDSVRPLVDQALAWAQRADAHPATVAAVLAGEILAIRPFETGNQRLAAFLVRLMLHRRDIAGAGFIPMRDHLSFHEDASLVVLVQTLAEGRPDAWINFVLARLQRAYQEVCAEAHLAGRLVDQTNERQWRLAAWFHDQQATGPDRWWRYREIQAAFPGVAPRTLKRDLSHLRQMDILEMRGKLKTSRYRFVAELAVPRAAPPRPVSSPVVQGPAPASSPDGGTGPGPGSDARGPPAPSEPEAC